MLALRQSEIDDSEPNGWPGAGARSITCGMSLTAVEVPVMKIARRALIVAVAALLCAASALAQGSGSIKGRATDSAGGVLQGAIVTLSPRGGSAVTNTQGEYTISGLTPGEYTVIVNYLGFTPFTKTVDVSAGAAETVN